MIVPQYAQCVVFSRYECVDVYNDQLIVETASELTFSIKNVWKRCQCVEKHWKIIVKHLTKCQRLMGNIVNALQIIAEH